jgi:ABC-type multidrug transport system permease subunit
LSKDSVITLILLVINLAYNLHAAYSNILTTFMMLCSCYVSVVSQLVMLFLSKVRYRVRKSIPFDHNISVQSSSLPRALFFSPKFYIVLLSTPKTKLNSVACTSQANYIDRAAAAC